MIDRTTKLRWRRRVRRGRQQVEDFGLQTEETLERHLFKRLTRLYNVRRFIAAWLLLLGLLITGVIIQNRALTGYYQTLKPVPGGTYTEGIIGSFTNANPLYASGSVDRAVSRLVFSGLLTYDVGNKLVGDLATDWQVDSTGQVYTVHLRKDAKWHDGQAVTAADVIYTYKTIQNPDAKSNLQSSWAGIKLEQPDDYTVIFRLPNTLSSFPYALTTGIIPKHILDKVPAGQLRAHRFNTVAPVGSGPFKWQVIEVEGTDVTSRQELVGLTANEQYYAGQPKLDRFVIRSFRDEDQLLASFDKQELNAMVGLSTLSDKLKNANNIDVYNTPLTGEVMVFFRMGQEILQDSRVRQALVKAADPKAIISGLDHPVISANGPLLKQHLGYDKNLVQFTTNIDEANALLEGAGWVKGADGIRTKDGKPLTFKLTAQPTAEYLYVTRQLQKEWRQVGANVTVESPQESDFQSAVANHSYDALLYGLSLGDDPDVFAYWHSSQAQARALNFSEYKSTTADRALEAGRTRSDPTLRAAKYKPFLEAWRNDAPALALYQPRFLYVTHGKLYGFDTTFLNSSVDRYNLVQNWMIHEVKADK